MLVYVLANDFADSKSISFQKLLFTLYLSYDMNV